MRGKFLGLVRETVVKQYGQKTWEDLEAFGAGSAEADGTREDVPSGALAGWLGREAVAPLRDAYPSLFARHETLASFVRGLADDLPAVSSDHPGSAFDLRVLQAPDASLLVRVDAPPRICALLEGVISGASIHYGEPVTVSRLKCRNGGDNACVLQVSPVEDEASASVPEAQAAAN